MSFKHFQLLEAEWPLLYETATKAQSLANSDVRTAGFYARRGLELAIAWLYEHDGSVRLA